MSILIKNIKSVITCDDNDNVYKDVNIFINNGVIEHIGSELFEANHVIDGQDYYVYPGLINTHHHFYQIFTRNLPQVQDMELFDWLKTLYKIWANLDDNSIKYSSMVGMGELMKYGCTTTFDHHYVFTEDEQDGFIDVQFQAAKELGMRFIASRGSMCLGEKDGGLPPDSVIQCGDQILSDSERLIKKYHDSKKYSMSQVVLAPCSPFSVTSELMKESAKLARKYGVRLHTHLAETEDEVDFTIKQFGMRPLEYMQSVDWVGEDVWFAHGIYFNDDELELLKHTGTGITHCPISNMKLSSGIARIPEMIDMGIKVGLGVDGSASNDGSNMLEELRVAYLLHRLNSSRDAPTGYDILKLATRGSADVLGREDIGYIKEGMAADLFIIDSRTLEMVGTQLDPKSVLGTVGYKKPVEYTIINGKIRVYKGQLVDIDEKSLVDNANYEMEKLNKLI